MANREYDNLIRKANQRLARAQASGFGETYEIRQLYLAQLRGSKDIVINKKGQLQFKRSQNISSDTWQMINKIATRSSYTTANLKKKYKDFVQLGKTLPITQAEATRRVMATFNEIKNQFEYKWVLEILEKLSNIDSDEERAKTLKKVEKFLNKNADKYKYADDLKKAFDKKDFFKEKNDIKDFKQKMTEQFFNG